MKAIRRYCLLLLKSHYFSLCFLISFVLTNNVSASGLSDGIRAIPVFAKANLTYRLSRYIFSSGVIKWSSLSDFDTCPSPQLIKTKSSHPLSLLNFNKTRPRGITPQEPMPKNLILSNVIYIYPPYLSSFIDLSQFLDYSLMCASTITIRPPPCH
jgi:hypothetical protein